MGAVERERGCEGIGLVFLQDRGACIAASLKLDSSHSVSGKVAAMKLSRPDRSLIAWTLYFCVLFNVFVCGLGHGQMMGLELNGLGGQFCSSLGTKAPASDAGLGNPTASSWSNFFACPVCSAVTLGIVFLFCLAWLLGLGQKPRPAHERRNKAPPRYSWPSANPRASPAF